MFAVELNGLHLGYDMTVTKIVTSKGVQAPKDIIIKGVKKIEHHNNKVRIGISVIRKGYYQTWTDYKWTIVPLNAEVTLHEEEVKNAN